jgi:hypothetical protein
MIAVATKPIRVYEIRQPINIIAAMTMGLVNNSTMGILVLI